MARGGGLFDYRHRLVERVDVQETTAGAGFAAKAALRSGGGKTPGLQQSQRSDIIDLNKPGPR